MSDTGRADPLVICAITGRGGATEVDIHVPDDPSSLLTGYAPRFPSSQDVDEAARAMAYVGQPIGAGRPSVERWRGDSDAPAVVDDRWVPLGATLPGALPQGPAREGPRARLTVSPGAVRLSRRDPARAERSTERARVRDGKGQDLLALELARLGHFQERPESRAVITRWSRRSRNRMTNALAELDYSDMLTAAAVPAVVTLTYSGDWVPVAPTGAACKRHMRLLLRRYLRAWGTPLVGMWKLEFQRRGAPHFHIFMVPPRGRAHDAVTGGGLPFREWLAVTWVDIVDHPDPVEYARHLSVTAHPKTVDYAEGLRHRDPKRVAVYFSKHGVFRAKEYQNVVPPQWQAPGCGPGRFWGYWGLHRLTHSAELRPSDAVWAARIMRRWSRAQRTLRQPRVPRTPGGRPVAATWDVVGLAGAQLLELERHTGTRRVTRRVQRCAQGSGWLSVNDGPRFTHALTRAISIIGNGEDYA